MNITKKILLAAVLLVFSLAVTSTAYAVDVYLVYAGSDKAIQKELKSSLKSSGVTVKAYNVDLLAMADYSGKQKAIAKISKAKVVALINDKPKEALEGASFSNVVSISSADDITAITDKLK